jgi:hypothetical protein
MGEAGDIPCFPTARPSDIPGYQDIYGDSCEMHSICPVLAICVHFVWIARRFGMCGTWTSTGDSLIARYMYSFAFTCLIYCTFEHEQSFCYCYE